MANQGEYGDKPPKKWKLKGKGTVNADDLMTWLQEMSKWAAKARQDIVDLEKHTQHPPGDPGSPPPPPE